MDMQVKNRAWVKNAAIIFLAVLLGLTFFSNTIMNATLPEVSTKEVAPQSITAKVRGTGTVTANEAYEVKAPGGVEILSVLVRAGDAVKVGDPLIALGEGDSDELEEAKDKLETLERSYKIALLGISPKDYDDDKWNIQNLEIALDRAKDTLNELRSHTDETKTREIVKKAQEELDELNKKRDAILSSASSDPSEYNKLLKEVEDRKNACNEQQKTVDDLQSKYDNYQELISARNEASDSFNEAKAVYEGASEARKYAEYSDPKATTAEIAELKGKETEAKEKMDIAWAKYDIAQKSVDGFEDKDIETKYSDAKAKLDEANKALSDAEKKLKAFSITTTAGTTKELDEQIAKTQALIDSEQAKLDKINSARDAKDKAEQSYSSALHAFNLKLDADGRASTIKNIELQAQRDDIEKQKERIKELSGEGDNVILSKVSGTVSNIAVSSGKKVKKDDVLMTVNVDDLGYQMTVTVTSEQARRLHVGDTATISNYYWGNSIVATLDQITVDAKNPQTSKRLVFLLDGDVSEGQELTVSVGSKSASYDMVVPNSAVRTDSNGTFVLKVVSKNSPLGNRYTAARTSVEVIASDDSNSAIVGDISAWDYVITTSSKPVADKDLVKLA